MEGTIGQIIMWAGARVPFGWMECDGRILNKNAHSSLYQVIANIYGGNSASDTFALPDYRNVFVRGAGNEAPLGLRVEGVKNTVVSGNALGKFTLTTENLPQHTHKSTFNQTAIPPASQIEIAIPVDDSANASANIPSNNLILGKGVFPPSSATRIYSSNPATTTLKPFKVNMPTITGTVTNESVGNGKPVDLRFDFQGETKVIPPWASVKFIICAIGTFPQMEG